MSIPVVAIVEEVRSHALELGLFETVNGHEPKSAPSLHGLSGAIWLNAIAPDPRRSGLNQTAIRMELTFRIYSNALEEPADMIDPNVLDATAQYMEALSGDFTLNDYITAVDLLGMSGPGLSAKAGYLTQDSTAFRVMDIIVPLLLTEQWSQAK